MANPIDHDRLYDVLVVAGQASPGTVKLSGHDRKTPWDKKKADGQKGAKLTRKGDEPVEFTATFYLTRDALTGEDDWAEWDEWVQILIDSRDSPTPKALDVYHPDLAAPAIDVSSVVVARIGGAVHDGTLGTTIAVDFIENRPPKEASGGPAGSKAKKADPKKPDPDAARLAELDRLTNVYANTPWG